MKERLNGRSLLRAPPTSAALTDYDRQHLATYIMLLDAYAAGERWPDTVRRVFELDVPHDSSTANSIYNAHLARARWMTEVGYRLLLLEG